MLRLILILLLICGPAHANKLGTWNSPSLQLQLTQDGAACSIRNPASSAPAMALDMPWPCQFHLNPKGEIRSIRQGKSLYLMVESSRRLSGRDCETHLRAVKIDGRNWKISELQDKVASCPPFQWDSVIFSALFK